MQTGKTVFVYMDIPENRPDQISYPNKEDHIMDVILLAGVAVIDLLVVLCIKSMCEFVYKKIHK